MLERLEFGKESVEAAQEFVNSRRVPCQRTVQRVKIENGWYREPEEEVVCRSAGQAGGSEVWKSGDVTPRKMDGVEPKDSTFMAVYINQVSMDSQSPRPAIKQGVYARFSQVV